MEYKYLSHPSRPHGESLIGLLPDVLAMKAAADGRVHLTFSISIPARSALAAPLR